MSDDYMAAYLKTGEQVQQLQELLAIASRLLDPAQFTATLSNVFVMCGQGAIEPGEPARTLDKVGLMTGCKTLYVEYTEEGRHPDDTLAFTLFFSPDDGLLVIDWEDD